MRGLVFGEPSGLRLEKGLPVPVPSTGEALIRPTLAGVCSTDLEIVKGYMGFSGVLGHEFVGVVEKAPGAPELEGRRVAGEINIPCGHCRTCGAGWGNHCPTRSVLGIVNKDGVFAEYFTLPAANLHFVPDNVPDEAAVFTEPLAAAYRILEQFPARPGLRAAVLGAGRLGQLVVRVLAAEGAHVTAISRSRGKLDLVKDIAAATELESQVKGSALFELVVDCSGAPEGLARAMELVEPCGTIILKTTTMAPVSLTASRLVIDEITVIGSRCGPFAAALKALAEGKVNPAALVTRIMELDRAVEAMRLAASPGVMKVLLSSR